MTAEPYVTVGQQLAAIADPCPCGNQPEISIEKGGSADAYCSDMACKKGPIVVSTYPGEDIVEKWNADVRSRAWPVDSPHFAPIGG